MMRENEKRTLALPIDAPRLHFEHIALPRSHTIPLLEKKKRI